MAVRRNIYSEFLFESQCQLPVDRELEIFPYDLCNVAIA